jgi:molybdopterin synthase catalytic subunit
MSVRLQRTVLALARVVRLVREPIDLAALQALAAQDGALCLFAGVVRNENAGRRVIHLEYEAYEEMALEVLTRIEAEARRRWPVTEVRIVHRLGRLEIGEASVAVAVASPHRAEAFAACRFAIDTLKHEAPIWKKVFFEGGAVWVEGPGQCGQDHA